MAAEQTHPRDFYPVTMRSAGGGRVYITDGALRLSDEGLVFSWEAGLFRKSMKHRGWAWADTDGFLARDETGALTLLPSREEPMRFEVDPGLRDAAFDAAMHYFLLGKYR